MQGPFTLHPNAKINIGLNILRKRKDGFHDISSIFFPVPLQDHLTFHPAENFQFKETGLGSGAGGEENLCVKAYQLLARDFTLPPVALELEKQIPAGAGLGGGSSDAAFTLKGFSSGAMLGLTKEALEGYAARLGSDCPFFIRNKPMVASGRGEVLTPVDIDLANWWLVLVVPELHISTAEAYAGVEPGKPGFDLQHLPELPVEHWREVLHNDFEKHLFQKHPELAQIKDELYSRGATYAQMSGSGSTIFGLFREKPGLPQEWQQQMRLLWMKEL